MFDELNISVFLLLLTRCTGFFLFSPLFVNKGITINLRIAFTATTALLLSPALVLHSEKEYLSSTLFFLYLFKEFLIGYLIGFIFSLLVEALVFAGEILTVLSGLSATQLLNPLNPSSYPLLSRFFVSCAVLFLLVLDLHHIILKTLFSTFTLQPSRFYSDQIPFISLIVKSTSFIFSQALEFVWYPFVILFLVILTLAILARVFPNFPIFWTGLSLQLLVGLSILAMTMTYFPEILVRSVMLFYHLLKRILFEFVPSV